MHIDTLQRWQHSHDFSDNYDRAETVTARVMLLTAVMMIVEIAAGTVFGSMALLGDGWHMATHVTAFGITLFTYRYARRHANSPRYTYGTGKVSVLGGFASAIALAIVALVMALESVSRLFQPQSIQFNDAMIVAALGLAVNLVTGLMLQGHDHHDHHHGHDHHDHDHHDHHDHPDHPEHDDHPEYHGRAPQDHNLRAAYFHVLADALTSVLAILALLSGKFLGWTWLDPVMGLVGAVVITRWAYGLMRDSSAILLDESVSKATQSAIIAAIESDADNRITDLHVWHIGQNHLAATLALVTHYPQAPEHYKKRLAQIPHLVHVIVEINNCSGSPCIAVNLAELAHSHSH